MLIQEHIEWPHGATPRIKTLGPGMARYAARCLAMATASAVRLITCAEVRWVGPSWVGSVPSGAQRIYVANHTSHADFILLWASLPPCLRSRTHPVAAADYWQRGVVRRLLIEDVFEGVLVERGRAGRARNPLAPMLRALDSGESLIVFPEGTRGNGDQLRAFKCGIYHLARERTNVELVPVWIENLHRVLPRGAIVPVPLLCSVTFGEPTRLAPGEDKTTFLARMRQSVIDLGGSCRHC
jgi:1-acyl-sn-glycerol-3-phosphate acyltransferase